MTLVEDDNVIQAFTADRMFGIEGQYDFVRATFTDGSNVPRIPPVRMAAACSGATQIGSRASPCCAPRRRMTSP